MGILDQVFGGGASRSGSGGMSPVTMALLALLAYRTMNGKGRLADMLGRGDGAGTATGGAPMGMPTGGGGLGGALGGGLGDLLRGGLGGILGGGAAGGALGGGLGELLRRMQSNGYGDRADSWVSTGPNRAISPDELQRALGPDIDELAETSGMDQRQILESLSRDLPDTVDRLTPEGRLPTGDEGARWV